MSKLPPHLQERMEKLAEQQSERLTSTLVDADSRARHFKAGYQQAYSDILQELGPAVKAIEGLQCYCHFDCTCGNDEARKALKRLKERILNGNNT